ncbi:acyltransferase [Pseudomonas caspiana]|uniref:Galactoside O-acetyltransferase n=1 Tax=Pseudomonas caspiana TaxID=1451454 RepID=A0A1Y3NVD1_9PSED|nr:acyltransferase [Pseudomonas caspiana]OUM71568.1 galactoside O-acetyltransferase [Pseudomonas caspiana]
MGFLNKTQIEKMGFASVGENPQLSDKASYYNCAKIIIGDNVRIDDFCVLSAGAEGIVLGNYIHIAVSSLLIGAGKITMRDFSGLSSKVSIYSSTDDYSGISMTNPTVPDDFRKVKNADVNIGRHVIIGAGSVVLPGVVLEQGVAVGALSLVSKSCKEFGIYSGVPAKRIKERKRNLLELEQQFIAERESELRVQMH